MEGQGVEGVSWGQLCDDVLIKECRIKIKVVKRRLSESFVKSRRPQFFVKWNYFHLRNRRIGIGFDKITPREVPSSRRVNYVCRFTSERD